MGRSWYDGTHRSPLNLPSEALTNSGDTLRGDAVDHVLGIGDYQGDIVAVDYGADETARAELVDLGVRGAVQVQGDAVAVVVGLVAPAQDRGVVAADLGAAGAVGGGTVELVEDQAVDGVGAVVDARGHHVDAEHVLLGRVEAELRAGAVDLRADVHGGAGLVRRHVLGIQGDGGLDGLEEQLGRHGGHADVPGRVLHAGSIAVGAEDLDFVGRRAEGLEALIGLLAVVQGRRHAVDPEERIGHELWRGPFSRLVGEVRLDVAVDCRWLRLH